MSSTNNFVFKVLQVIAWIIFVGLCIEAGGLLVNFLFSIFKPQSVPNLYQKLDLSHLYEGNKAVFFGMYSFILAIALSKAYLFYIVIRLLSKLDLARPFSHYVAEQIAQISHYTFLIGILGYIAREIARNQQHHGFAAGHLNGFWADSQAFILMAAVVYIIATIFRKGVELQKEIDLTV
ncbi:DUF2975 domain-containing protein [Flaviaesturariibacter amylovorans]|uniref:DUF2975 domain-containing protein n=1 Tax=Flaviaesturariibacter amylovorans TaxID=1084520 RepID=A0ABP8GHF1_9BACT